MYRLSRFGQGLLHTQRTHRYESLIVCVKLFVNKLHRFGRKTVNHKVAIASIIYIYRLS
jgi:hypothetical protein